MRPYKSAILRDYLVGNAALGVPQYLFDKPQGRPMGVPAVMCVFMLSFFCN